MSFVGRWLSIQCYKHDGNLHRFWDRGLVLDCNDDYIVVATKRAKVIESNGRRWFTKEPAVTIFSKKEWWNVICMFKTNGICYYCNIASPSIVEDMAIKYIDYDLDTKLFADGDMRILDEKEYLRHKKNYQYSDDLDKVLRSQTKENVTRMKDRAFPFQDDKIQAYYDEFLKIIEKK